MKLSRPAASVAAAAIFSVAGAVSADTLVDDYSTGNVNLAACGNSAFNYFEDASILGGAREVHVRDGHSCVFGGQARITIANDVAAFYGRSACETSIQYGTSIGTVDRPWSLSPNKNKGTELNLALTLADEFILDVAALASNGYGNVAIQLRTGAGVFTQWFTAPGVGEFSAPLADFAGITSAAAADIDGIVVVAGGCNSNNVADAFMLDSIAIGGGDSDGDGVGDADDLCPATPAGAIVNGNGCSGTQAVALVCPAEDTYKNHGAYVSCVSKAVEDAVLAGLLTDESGEEIVSAAARSNVGKKKK